MDCRNAALNYIAGQNLQSKTFRGKTPKPTKISLSKILGYAVRTYVSQFMLQMLS